LEHGFIGICALEMFNATDRQPIGCGFIFFVVSENKFLVFIRLRVCCGCKYLQRKDLVADISQQWTYGPLSVVPDGLWFFVQISFAMPTSIVLLSREIGCKTAAGIFIADCVV
jgi:hypothetical protein